MKKGWIVGLAALGLLGFIAAAARADEGYDKTLPQVAKLAAAAKLTLADGIKAAASEGKPISAQYEIDEDSHQFQLSVFVSKGSDLLEVIIDHNSGATKSVENVVGDDIKDAKKQRSAMAKANTALADAADAAAKANAGYQVMQIIPSLAGDGAVATIKLTKGSDIKTVQQKL